MSSLNFDKNPFGVHKKMIYHMDRMYEYLNGDTFPINVEVNLTDICNLKCNYCFCDHRGNDIIDINTVLSFLKDYKRMGGKSITFSGGGEPTLHKDFSKIVEYAKSLDLDLGLITNGTFNNNLIHVINDNFKWIRISLDTLNYDEYFKIKKVNKLGRVLSNIDLFTTLEHKCKVGINCNVNSDMSLVNVKDLIGNLCDMVDYIQFRPVLPRFIHKEKVNLNDKVWDYLKTVNNKKVVVSFDKFIDLINDNKYFPFKSCEGHFISPILDASGDFRVCMYHPGNDNFKFGNIYDNNLEYIWNSEKRKNVIKYVRNHNYYKNCQVCCKLFEINKFIDFVKYPDNNLDINFL